MGTGESNAGGNPALALHAIQGGGGGEILLVASCYSNRIYRPSRLVADFTLLYTSQKKIPKRTVTTKITKTTNQGRNTNKCNKSLKESTLLTNVTKICGENNSYSKPY